MEMINHQVGYLEGIVVDNIYIYIYSTFDLDISEEINEFLRSDFLRWIVLLEVSSSGACSSWEPTEGILSDTETLSSFLLDISTGLDITFFVVAIWFDFKFFRVLRAIVLCTVGWNLNDRKFAQ